MRYLVLLAGLFCGLASYGADDFPRVVMKTTLGDIVIELNRKAAPVTVRNFLAYAEKRDFDGLIFHRVMKGFMIQGGGLTPAMEQRPEGEEIWNEADNGLRNEFGTISMARHDEIDSASRQFFINLRDNVHLDHTSESCTREQQASVEAARERGLYKPMTCKSFGHAVFGKVVGGMDVVRAIENSPVEIRQGYENVPVTPIIIEAVRRLEE